MLILGMIFCWWAPTKMVLLEMDYVSYPQRELPSRFVLSNCLHFGINFMCSLDIRLLFFSLAAKEGISSCWCVRASSIWSPFLKYKCVYIHQCVVIVKENKKITTNIPTVRAWFILSSLMMWWITDQKVTSKCGF